jgi:transposase
MNDPSSSPTPACPQCAELLKRIVELEALVRSLQERLNQNSSNSSIPPSANPLNAPKPVSKAPSGRKPGGQTGHPGHHRHRLPPERVSKIVPYVPVICSQCQAPLPAEPGPGDPEPTWHQVAELPELAATITEHQGHARTCACCGHLNRDEIPPEIRTHVIGPRLAAVMSYLTGRHHISRRGVEEIVETVFEVPTSLGSVSALEGETSAALASPYQEVQAAVREAPVKNTDETSWKEKGKKRWLWSAATATAALFVIHLRRNFAGLQALLGEAITGIVCSDRWSVYNKLPLNLRQICWAHLKRDFQKLVDRGGPAEAIGRVGLDVVECLFADWWAFRRGELDRPDCKPGWTRLRANSKVFWSKVAPALIPRRRLFAPISWGYIRRCGCSQRSKVSSPRTTTWNASCAWECSGGRMPLAATARPGVDSWSGC